MPKNNLYPKKRLLQMNYSIMKSAVINTNKEYTAVFRYIVTKYFSLSTHYDCDIGLGGGITFTY